MSAYKTYLLDYFHDGAWWCVEISATSLDDAKVRMRQIGVTGRIAGTLEMVIPARLGFFARAYCGLRNLWKGAVN